ncbi:F-box only protein 40-like isoform X2 [Watersipora subatra]|uniref:F-box only protein 40-like isoform X2 n=1 Tax=Watersipora subatra TaxID=2589382 RepID=UPI00355AF3D3
MVAQHEHCEQCYDMNCQLVLTPNVEENCCKVVACPSGCETRLHECKVEEHQEHICTSHVVPCINSSYGCPHKFSRNKLISHLHHCPASVVTCKLEWNRELVRSQPNLQATERPQNVSDILDISLAAKDKRILEASLRMPKSLRNALQNTYTRNFPAVPFVQRSSDVPEEDTADNGIDCLLFPQTQDAKAGCQAHRDIPGYAASSQSVHCSLCKAPKEHRGGEGLANSINNALTKIRNDQSQDKKVQKKESEIITEKDRKVDLNLHLGQEMYSSFRAKPENMMTFLCAQDFRRDQFSSHYLTSHMVIQTGLNGWFQERCPLATYGCPFTQQRFITDKHERTFFNPVTDSFYLGSAIEPDVEKSVAGVAESQRVPEVFSKLPELVLLQLFSYLDSLSIKNLSLTSKIWSFSNAFERPRAWLFADKIHMGEHLKTCPYNIDKNPNSSEEAIISNQQVMMQLSRRLSTESTTSA